MAKSSKEMGRLNIQQRLQVLRLKKEGRTHAHIKRKLRCSLGTVRRVLKNYRLQKNVNDQPRKPAPSKTVDQDMQIIAAIVDEPFLTLKELKRELGLTLSVSTIAKRLKNLGLISLNNSSNRALTDCMKDARLSFARAHASWTADRWRSVVFTNESTICCKWDPNKSSWKAVHIWYDVTEEQRYSLSPCVSPPSGMHYSIFERSARDVTHLTP